MKSRTTIKQKPNQDRCYLLMNELEAGDKFKYPSKDDYYIVTDEDRIVDLITGLEYEIDDRISGREVVRIDVDIVFCISSRQLPSRPDER